MQEDAGRVAEHMDALSHAITEDHLFQSLGTTAERGRGRVWASLFTHALYQGCPWINKASEWQGTDLKQGQVVAFPKMNQPPLAPTTWES